MKKQLSSIIFLCLISPVLFLTYCAPGIKIYVDRPEVFTKERLVKQRLQERQWLEGKLKEKYVPGYQGLQDVRAFSGLLADFQGVYDPANKLTAARIEAERVQIIRDKQRADLQHQVDMRRLQKQLENPPDEADENDDNTPIEGTEDFYKGLNNSFKSDNYSALIDTSNLQTTKAKLTGIESLRDEKAYRDAIQAMIRETDLDDAHDLYGNTIYTLKFDVSVFPKGDYASYYNMGKINIKLDRVPLSHEGYVSLYNEWRKSLDKEIRMEALNFHRRLDLGLITPQEEIKLEAKAMQLLHMHIETLTKMEMRVAKLKEEAGKEKEKSERLQVRAKELKKQANEKRTEAGMKENEAEELIKKADELKKHANDIMKMAEKKRAEAEMKENEAEELIKKAEELKKQANDIMKTSNEKRAEAEMKENEAEGLIKKAKKSEKQANTKEQKAQEKGQELSQKQKELGPEIKKLEDYLNQPEPKGLFIKQKKSPVLHKMIDTSIEDKYNILKDIVKIKSPKAIKKSTGYFTVKTAPLSEEEEKGIITELKKKYESRFHYKLKLPNDLDIIDKLKVSEIEEVISKIKGAGREIKKDFLRFVINIKKLEKKKSTYVYTVEPKEYAQNISQVQASEKLKNLVLSLQALIPTKGVKAGSYLNRLKRSQERLNSILRKPLVVGYIDGRQTFGWLLGPRFQINREKKVNFEHTPVQYSLQASIVVPGWYKEIKLTGNYKWDNWDKAQLWKEKKVLGKREPIRAQLPGDMSLLTEAFLNMSGSTRHRQPPDIFPGQGPFKILLQAKRKEYLLIQGKRLWRNPEVFIGSQKADKIEILPDMQGLLATFKEVRMPVIPRVENPKEKKKTAPKDEAKVDLTVITSNGSATLKEAVIIREAPKKKQESKPDIKAKIVTLRAYPGSNFILSVPAKSIPEKSIEIKLQVKPKGGKGWKDFKTETPTFGPKKEKITFKIDKEKGYDSNAELSAQLLYKEKESSPFVTVPVTGGVDDSFIYFTKKEMFKANLAIGGGGISCSQQDGIVQITGKITISFETGGLFLKATPGLKDAVNSGFKLLFSLKDNQPPRTIVELKKDKDHFLYEEKDKTGTITIIDGKLDSSKIEGIRWIYNVMNEPDVTGKDFYLWIKLPDGKPLKLNPGTLKIKKNRG